MLSTHQSFLDIFYYMYVTSPTFTKISVERDIAFFSPLNFFESLKLAFTKRFIIPKENENLRKMELTTLVEQSYDTYLGPIVVFFECCPTTGKAMIKPDSAILSAFDKNHQKYLRFMILFSLDYSRNSNSFSPVNIPENRFLTMLKVMSNPITKLNVRVEKTLNRIGSSEDVLTNFYTHKLKLNSLNIPSSTYEGFLDYYEGQGKKIEKKKRS